MRIVIPDFTDRGELPAGVHAANLAEFQERFVRFDRSDQRVRLFDGLRELLEAARQVKFVKRVLVGGSYVTSKAEPNDFDCIVVLDPSVIDNELRPFEYRLLSRRSARKAFGGDVVPVIDGSEAMARYMQFFQLNRQGESVGIVEIEL